MNWKCLQIERVITTLKRNYSASSAHIPRTSHTQVETKWKERWYLEPERYSIDHGKEKRYILSMFPYPSGSLHMGHVRVYTISDALSRYQRLRGHPTLHPMGWDAFGLPAENAAIERAIPPAIWTHSNISQMRTQLESLSLLIDWDRTVTTCEESYYRWTQWLFLRLFKKGLAYRRKAEVNWDPVDETVLADEQVDSQGISWRSGAKVEKRPLTQWFLRITQYQNQLLEGLEGLRWPTAIKEMQRNWIIETGVYHYRLTNDLTVSVKKKDEWTFAEAILVDPKSPISITEIENPFTLRPLPIIRSSDPFTDPSIAHLQPSRTFTKPSIPLDSIPGEFVITNYRLRDWLISRQRYWGTPIPIVHCTSCGVNIIA